MMLFQLFVITLLLNHCGNLSWILGGQMVTLKKVELEALRSHKNFIYTLIIGLILSWICFFLKVGNSGGPLVNLVCMKTERKEFDDLGRILKIMNNNINKIPCSQFYTLNQRSSLGFVWMVIFIKKEVNYYFKPCLSLFYVEWYHLVMSVKLYHSTSFIMVMLLPFIESFLCSFMYTNQLQTWMNMNISIVMVFFFLFH